MYIGITLYCRNVLLGTVGNWLEDDEERQSKLQCCWPYRRIQSYKEDGYVAYSYVKTKQVIYKMGQVHILVHVQCILINKPPYGGGRPSQLSDFPPLSHALAFVPMLLNTINPLFYGVVDGHILHLMIIQLLVTNVS